MSYQAIEGVARYDNQERISTENRWQQYLEMRSRNNNRLNETNQSQSKEFKNQTSEEAEEENKVLFERPNQQSLETLKRKVSNGEELSSSEKAYLQQYDPQTYRKVAEREQELKEYKRILQEAKTKEDVRNAKINHSGVAYNKLARYAENAVTVESDYLLDEEKSTYDRVV